MTQQRVLVVEDEPDLRTLVAHHLDLAGWQVMEAGSVRESLALARAHVPELVVLDIMLPDGNGIEVCRTLRADVALSATAILLLTARGSEIDRVAGLEAGADDYVVKPFSVRELVLRCRAVLRRRQPAATAAHRWQAHGIALDDQAHTASVDGAPIELTALEFRLLHRFLCHPGVVLTRQRLLEEVWQMRPDLQTRTVDTHVKRLRETLGRAGDAIETVRGLGYRMKPSAP
ncbi:MAG: response regulator [Deltaproteobacteria bacterium]|nr:response regulator [Deltaproteobacteria bacterium]